MKELDFLRKERPRRRDGVALPLRSPQGWTHFLIAAGKIVAALFPDEEGGWPRAVSSLIDMAHDPDFDVEGNSPAHDIANYIAEQICAVCANETLITGYRQIGGGGRVHRMRGHLWELENPALRFRTWSFDPSAPYSMRDDLPCWIWVQTKSLHYQLERIERFQRRQRIKGTYEGEWLTLAEAVEAVRHLGETDAARLRALLWLCASGGCQGVAGRYVRFFRGDAVEQDLHLPVSSAVWRAISPLDPLNNLASGQLVARDGESLHQIADVRFDGEMLRAALGNGFIPRAESNSHTGNSTSAVGPKRIEVSDCFIEEWAIDAAKRGVTVTDARRDAVEKLGERAPPQYEARAKLKDAKTSLGQEVRRGRPLGSKSWTKKQK